MINLQAHILVNKFKFSSGNIQCASVRLFLRTLVFVNHALHNNNKRVSTILAISKPAI